MCQCILQLYPGFRTSGFKSKENGDSPVRTVLKSGQSIRMPQYADIFCPDFGVQNSNYLITGHSISGLLRYPDTRYPDNRYPDNRYPESESRGITLLRMRGAGTLSTFVYKGTPLQMRQACSIFSFSRYVSHFLMI